MRTCACSQFIAVAFRLAASQPSNVAGKASTAGRALPALKGPAPVRIAGMVEGGQRIGQRHQRGDLGRRKPAQPFDQALGLIEQAGLGRRHGGERES